MPCVCRELQRRRRNPRLLAQSLCSASQEHRQSCRGGGGCRNHYRRPAAAEIFPHGSERPSSQRRAPRARRACRVHRVRALSFQRAVNVAEGHSLWKFAPQHAELVPKNKDFGFQRSPRPEQSNQGAPDQSAKIDLHRQTSADSLTLARGFKFAVGTI